MASSSSNKTALFVYNLFVGIAAVWFLVQASDFRDTPLVNLALPKVGDLWANQVFGIAGLSCLAIFVLNNLVLGCCSDSCFDMMAVVTIVHAIGVILFTWPVLQDFFTFEEAAKGNPEQVAAAGEKMIVNGLNNIFG